ncbi:ribonuclease H-like YkuK family protein [Bacillus pinisoli]|uniref:ribonuclease H-like YkuK family protein n=1 Tax=Bacillus pinisoli TaxID=2901866 RepID=UPI001FF4AB7E|nr:ribonuclease H-like YkuK family protein [Bacillus pinisoli]
MSDRLLFQNISENNMTFERVFSKIITFLKQEPSSIYHLSIGTDSQVHQNETKFISAIHLHRVGKGAWGCLRELVLPREVRSVREKISMETAYSQELASLFTTEHFNEMTDVLLPYADEGADLRFQIHLDIGRKGVTKDLIQEMTSRIISMGIEAKIKPDSYAASSYANRYTK